METTTDKDMTYKWSKEMTEAFIKMRAENAYLFTGVKHSARLGWSIVLEKMGLLGRVEPQQAKKKWDNLKKKYKDCKYPGTAERAGGIPSAATWPWFSLMDEALAERSSTATPVPIAMLLGLKQEQAEVEVDEDEEEEGEAEAEAEVEAEAEEEQEMPVPEPPRKRRKAGDDELLDLLREDMRQQREDMRQQREDMRQQREDMRQLREDMRQLREEMHQLREAEERRARDSKVEIAQISLLEKMVDQR